MLPLLPILILLLLGPANAERLAVEGRLPAALLAVHLAQTAPLRAAAIHVANETEAESEKASIALPVAVRRIDGTPRLGWSKWTNPGCPPRAGPQVV